MAVPAWPGGIRDLGSIRADVLVDLLAIDATAITKGNKTSLGSKPCPEIHHGELPDQERSCERCCSTLPHNICSLRTGALARPPSRIAEGLVKDLGADLSG